MNAHLTRRRAFWLAILCLPLWGVADYATGYEFGFFAFYFIPVALAAWHSGGREGLAVAILSAVVWFVSDRLSGHPYSNRWFEIWNVVIRFVSFAIVSFTLSRIRTLLVKEQAISADLRRALGEVKALSGLLPICSWCHRIRNDAGYWQRLEEYIGQRTDAEFTHGVCGECAAKILKESVLSARTETSQAPNGRA